MHVSLVLASLALVALSVLTQPVRAQDRDPALWARAKQLAKKHILVDGHVDVPYRLADGLEDISQRTEGGDFDYVRAVTGGLDAPFMSIYVAASYQETGGAFQKANALIDLVHGFAERWPDKYAIATSPEDVRRHHARGLVSLPMGLENGAPIEGDLEKLRHLYDRGIRYVTLTHSLDNDLSDSSYDTTDTWGGLSPFGEEVVREMNRLGMMVDVSHLSDNAFRDVLRVTEEPVIASHSSMRRFTPGWERNMNDVMLRNLAENGGIVMINFGSSFLRSEYQAEGERLQARIDAELERRGIDRASPAGAAYVREQRRANPIGTLDDVVAHIDHAVRLVGVDHVGLGSDFDGVFALPKGLQDVSEYPNLVYALLEKGYSEQDIAKILGENLLRVWSEVQR